LEATEDEERSRCHQRKEEREMAGAPTRGGAFDARKWTTKKKLLVAMKAKGEKKN